MNQNTNTHNVTHNPLHHHMWITGQDAPLVVSSEGASPLLFGKLGNLNVSTTTSLAVSVGDKVINVVSAAGMLVGDSLFIVDATVGIVEAFTILSVTANAVTIDTPSGNAFAAGLFVGSSNLNMAVDGSVTPVRFNLKTGVEDFPVTIHLSRIIFHMETATEPGMNLFGDIAALTNGIYLRKIDGETITYFNIKTNGGLSEIAYDVDFYDAAKFGTYGIGCRLTFTKLGSFIELTQNDDLELWIQDDLTGISKFTAVVEGHFVG